VDTRPEIHFSAADLQSLPKQNIDIVESNPADTRLTCEAFKAAGVTSETVPQAMPTSLGAQKVWPVSQDSFYNLIHDLRQPLSAIASIAYCLELTVPVEQVQARLYISSLHQLVADASSALSRAARESSEPALV
jgi:hypothetical protein